MPRSNVSFLPQWLEAGTSLRYITRLPSLPTYESKLPHDNTSSKHLLRSTLRHYNSHTLQYSDPVVSITMEEARHAIEAFLARNGHHDTTVHETVAPAVTHELVTRTEHRASLLHDKTPSSEIRMG